MEDWKERLENLYFQYAGLNRTPRLASKELYDKNFGVLVDFIDQEIKRAKIEVLDRIFRGCSTVGNNRGEYYAVSMKSVDRILKENGLKFGYANGVEDLISELEKE